MIPYISIVLVNYNGGRYLARSLQSVVDQLTSAAELIVVDGGSTDASVSIIRRCSEHITWWVSEPDSGQSEALNKGFRRARGRFFFWLNSDDLLLPGSLAHAGNYLRQFPDVKWLVANTIFTGPDERVIRCAWGPPWSDCLLSHAPLTVYGPTSIFAREAFDAAGGFDETLHYAMDTDLWLKFKQLGLKYSQAGRYYWAFRIHESSKTSHAFSGAPNPSFQMEHHRLKERHGLTHTSGGLWLQRCGKIVSGAYPKALFDTLRFRGRDIDNIYEQSR